MSGDTKKSCPAQNSDEAIAWAAENGLKVVFPEDNQLLIDIDNEAARSTFDAVNNLIDEAYGIEEIHTGESRGGNQHFTVTLKRNITPIERIALQAVLGSDPRREAHSLRRWLAGEKNPTLFFEKPE